MKYAIWQEPYSNDPLINVECKMSYDDIVKLRRSLEPRYTSDDQVFMDFVTVHWAKVVEE